MLRLGTQSAVKVWIALAPQTIATVILIVWDLMTAATILWKLVQVSITLPPLICSLFFQLPTS